MTSPNAQKVVRYSYAERLCHWLSAASYTYCLAGGLAFYSPYLYWLAAVLGGGPTARFWHPVGGLLFAGAAIWMHRMWSPDMHLTDIDRRWSTKIRFYAENRDEMVPPSDRFNAGQKQFYWAMFYGAIALLLSGLVLWFPEILPAGLRWLRAVAIVVHEIAALVTIGAFIIHIYMGIFFVKGGVEGIVTGNVSAAWARAHHRLWYDRVAGSAAKK